MAIFNCFVENGFDNKNIKYIIKRDLDMDKIREYILKANNYSEDIEEKASLIFNKYYKHINFQPYLNTRNKLIQMIVEEEFPTTKEWNKIANEEGYYTSISIKFIEGCDWKRLKKKLQEELQELLKR